MKALVTCAPLYRAYADWKKVQGALADPAQFLPIAAKLLQHYDSLVAAYTQAQAIIAAYPKSDGAQVLRDMLAVGEPERVLAPTFLPALKREVAALRRKYSDGLEPLLKCQVSALLNETTPIAQVTYPQGKLKLVAAPYAPDQQYCDIRGQYAGAKQKDGLLYARAAYAAPKAGPGKLRVGADGPFKVFVNGQEVHCNRQATNPISAHLATVDVTWRKGRNEVLLALRTNRGNAWGFSLAAATSR
jgi:hypothetical protein